MLSLTPEPWLTLQEAKDHLNIPAGNTGEDAELTLFLRRTEGALTDRVGHVKQHTETVTSYRPGGRATVRLEADLPVGLIVAVSVGGTPVPAADLDTGAAGWYVGDAVDDKVGILRHTSRFPSGFVKVEHQPGRDPIPANLMLASLELLRHLWKTQRGNLGNRPGLRGEALDPTQTTEKAPIGFSFPNRVEELIAPYLIPAAG